MDLFTAQRRPTLSIIGTAGRKDDGPRITRRLVGGMYDWTLRTIAEWRVRHGVSGGAAVADHMAVMAYLDKELDGLILHLPAEFHRGRFVEKTGDRFDPGRTANYYHAMFSTAVGTDSLAQIARAIEKGASVTVGAGFKSRNTTVANDSTHMLAFTFGTDAAPADLRLGDAGFLDPEVAGLRDPGTADTYGKARDCIVKRHVSLSWLGRLMEAVAAAEEESTAPEPF